MTIQEKLFSIEKKLTNPEGMGDLVWAQEQLTKILDLIRKGFKWDDNYEFSLGDKN